jgi:hypothetical protein
MDLQDFPVYPCQPLLAPAYACLCIARILLPCQLIQLNHVALDVVDDLCV